MRSPFFSHWNADDDGDYLGNAAYGAPNVREVRSNYVGADNDGFSNLVLTKIIYEKTTIFTKSKGLDERISLR